jgi:transketolase
MQQMTTQQDTWKELAQQFRVDGIRMSTRAGSGHPTSGMSAAELISVFLSKYFRYDFAHPQNPNNDRLVFSKGHATPLYYPMFKAAGAITDEELMTYRTFGSRLEGHPVPSALPWVEVATGSLGQGLPLSVGLALAGKYLEKRDYRVWCLLGDSEMAEGSQWEAFEHASYYKLGNLVAMLDMNRLGQRGQTMPGWNSALYARRAQAFGWHTIEIDGHDVTQVDQALAEAVQTREQPTLIVARTVKGKGVSLVEDKNGWHGKALTEEQARQAIEELGGVRHLTVQVQKPAPAEPVRYARSEPRRPTFSAAIATREAYGHALAALGDAWPDVVVLDGEVCNSTYAEIFRDAHPDRFFEMFIAEQQMIAAAIGISVRGFTVFASTFAAFMTRAYDFIRMGAVSRANLRLCGSHAGCSIGQDGPSQMGLEDLAMMRAVGGSTVLYPCDGPSTAALVFEMARRPGISYLRTTRSKTPILYRADEEFPIGGSKTLRRSDSDQATVFTAGITVGEALKAADQLKAEGVNLRVVDLYSIKPVDVATLAAAARETGRIVTVEDHWPEGGLGEAVLSGLAEAGVCVPVRKLAVRSMPRSGTPEELMDDAGISTVHIVKAVKSLL